MLSLLCGKLFPLLPSLVDRFYFLSLSLYVFFLKKPKSRTSEEKIFKYVYREIKILGREGGTMINVNLIPIVRESEGVWESYALAATEKGLYISLIC